MTSTALQHPPPTATGTAPLAASALQKLLPDLVAMSLNAKQAHWNLTGPTFLPMHALTEQIASDALRWADRVAERTVALGFTVDGRPGTVAATAGPFLAGRLGDREALDELGVLLDDVPTPTQSATTSSSQCSRASSSTAGCCTRRPPDHWWRPCDHPCPIPRPNRTSHDHKQRQPQQTPRTHDETGRSNRPPKPPGPTRLAGGERWPRLVPCQ
jgi:hypothetical protein